MNTLQPQISIIVPVYNAEKHLHNCINGILAQTFTNFELILINDGSPDRCGKICDEYASKDCRIKVIHKENGGASDARNIGLDNAIGERICFIDSDDTIDDNFLEIFNYKDADIVIQGIYTSTNGGEEKYIPLLEGYFTEKEIDILIENLWNVNNIGYLVTRSFKRSIIEANKLRFNKEYRLREDEEFIWRYMLQCKTFATINKGAYHYDVPNYHSKYKDVEPYSNCRCTISRLNSILQLQKSYNYNIIVYNVNYLSESIFRIYKDKEMNDIDSLRYLLVQFCKFYKMSKSHTQLLSNKSKFFYYIVGTHTPTLIHKAYKLFLKSI